MNEVDAYISTFSGESKYRLELLRSIVHELVPEAAEAFSYGLIGYKYKKKPLVYFGGFDKHTGFYATPNGHQTFKEDFAQYKQGKGSVQFPLSQELPVDLIRRVIVFRKETLDA